MDKVEKFSKCTNKKYNILDSIKIVNIKQVCAYMANGVLPVDLYPSRDKESKERCMVFVFNKAETKEVYDLWCKHELK